MLLISVLFVVLVLPIFELSILVCLKKLQPIILLLVDTHQTT